MVLRFGLAPIQDTLAKVDSDHVNDPPIEGANSKVGGIAHGESCTRTIVTVGDGSAMSRSPRPTANGPVVEVDLGAILFLLVPIGAIPRYGMSKNSKHVVPNPAGGWAVKNSGATRASKTFDTQADAIDYGRAAAKKTQSELYIHGKDGTIKNKNSYGRDPNPPKDKK